jgi:hypothetical protein
MPHTEYHKKKSICICKGNKKRLKIGERGDFDCEENVEESETENAEKDSLVTEILTECRDKPTTWGAVVRVGVGLEDGEDSPG